jgi:hypothetical protein
LLPDRWLKQYVLGIDVINCPQIKLTGGIMPKKTVYTLSVNDYAPNITKLTFPLLKRWAKKIGADFHVIDKRVFDKKYPPVYEKFQIFELAKQHKNDWNIFFDADTLMHPDFWDITEVITKDITVSNGTDFSPIRFKPDKYFRRDGRFIGKGNWCMIASDWCTDIWEPLDEKNDITLEQAVEHIVPTAQESGTVVERSHLIDDFVVSRNIAKYGLKHVLIRDLEKARGVTETGLLWHEYRVPNDQKEIYMKRQLMGWAAQIIFVNGNIVVNGVTFQQIADILNQSDGVDWIDRMNTLPGDVGGKMKEIIKSWGIEL